MALGVQSVRAAPEHRDILQNVAALLRDGKADELRRLLGDVTAQPVGPFRSEEAAVAFLRDRLVSSLKPRMVWLFGSRARGIHRPDSDFDLLVVMPDGLPERFYTHGAVAEPLVACGVGYDVVPCSWSVFEQERNEPGTLVNAATTEGRLLYQDLALRRAERTAK